MVSHVSLLLVLFVYDEFCHIRVKFEVFNFFLVLLIIMQGGIYPKQCVVEGSGECEEQSNLRMIRPLIVISGTYEYVF